MAAIANPTELDLVNTLCPVGIQIEIVGFEKKACCLQGVSLFGAISNTFFILTPHTMLADEHFLKRITVLEFDPQKQYIKVRIAD